MPSKPKDPLAQLVAARLREEMDRRGVSEALLVRASGQRQQYVNRFLKGRMVHPSFTFVDGLAKVLKLRLSDLLSDESASEFSDEEIRLLAAWKARPEDERRAILRMLLGDYPKPGADHGEASPRRRGPGAVAPKDGRK